MASVRVLGWNMCTSVRISPLRGVRSLKRSSLQFIEFGHYVFVAQIFKTIANIFFERSPSSTKSPICANFADLIHQKEVNSRSLNIPTWCCMWKSLIDSSSCP